jgi:hypothetical protein
MNLAFDGSDLMGFLLLRLALIAAGVLLLAVLVIIAIVMLRRRGKLDQAKHYVQPIARNWADRGGPVRKTIVNYLDDDKPSR